jgi:hypothetical protein
LIFFIIYRRHKSFGKGVGGKTEIKIEGEFLKGNKVWLEFYGFGGEVCE